MPSSSKRSTKLEEQLHYFYKVSIFRLLFSGLQNQAEFIAREFADLLDYECQDLMDALEPAFQPERTTLAKYMQNMKIWENFKGVVRRASKSDNLYNAGNALSDAGALLFKTGRDDEAAKLCEWGSALWDAAVKAYEEEQTYSGHSKWDVEMG